MATPIDINPNKKLLVSTLPTAKTIAIAPIIPNNIDIKIPPEQTSHQFLINQY